MSNLKEKNLKIPLLFAISFLVLGGFFSWLFLISKINSSLAFFTSSSQLLTQTRFSKPDLFPRHLDGFMVREGEGNLYPVAVMIDNLPETRPGAGLEEAQVVYETLVEGGATRLMAVYTSISATSESKESQEEEWRIGPVRSARPYYLDWVSEYEALFVHAGGSPEALEKIDIFRIKDLDEIGINGPLYFFRDKNKKAPHNLFTSSSLLAKVLEEKGLVSEEPNYKDWLFGEIQNSSYSFPEVKKIFVDFSSGEAFDVKYLWDTENKSYLRFQGGESQLMSLRGKEPQIKNVIIQFIPRERFRGGDGRLALKVEGQGKVLVFRDGFLIEGTWRKKDRFSRTKFYYSTGSFAPFRGAQDDPKGSFYDSENKEIPLRAGQIWIEVVPGDEGVSYE